MRNRIIPFFTMAHLSVSKISMQSRGCCAIGLITVSSTIKGRQSSQKLSVCIGM